MSVPEGERKQSKYDPIVKAMELAVYTLRITSNQNVFKPEYKGAVTVRLEQLATDIYLDLWTANNVRPETRSRYEKRRELQFEAGLMCNELLALIQMAQRVFHLETKRVGYWGGQVVRLKGSIREWISSDRKRFR